MKLEELKPIKGIRTDFNESWLSEMPSGLGSYSSFDGVERTIKEFKKSGLEIKNLGNNLNKIDADTVIIYWYEKDGEIQLGTELGIKNQCLMVNMTGKNPKFKGKPPYASDLYNAILKDTNENLRLTSDKTLSDEGYGIWKKLFKLGHTISLYNTSDDAKIGSSLITLISIEDMDKYFKDNDSNYEKYQYVLSENSVSLALVRSQFILREYWESVPGMPLTD
jgi:hypothetical protein